MCFPSISLMVACFGIFTSEPTDVIMPSRITTVPFAIVFPGEAWMVAFVRAHALGGFLWSSFAGPTWAKMKEKIHSKIIVRFFIIILKN